MTKQERQGWAITATLFVSLFFLWGAGYNTSPVFFPALLHAFGYSKGRMALVSSAIALSVGITAPFAGALLDRIEARVVMPLGALVAGIGFLTLSRASSFHGLIVGAVVLGTGLGASTFLPASLVVANWFGERRGTALGVTTAGMELGGMGMTILAGYVIAHAGWRAAYAVLAIPAIVLIAPLLAIVVHTRPADGRVLNVARRADSLPGLETGEAIRTRAFWMLAVAELSWGVFVAGVFVHTVQYLIGLGYGRTMATGVLSLLLGLAAVGKPLMGALGDRIGGRTALGIGFLAMAVATAMLIFAEAPWILAAFVIVQGITGAAPVALVPMILAETLGLKRFGSLFGIMGFLMTLGLSIGAPMVGRMADLAGNYTGAFEVCVAIALVGAAASFACSAPVYLAIPRVAEAK